ncbi:hypothetical protein K490DRAFT_61409 [Saccharata proteae CBS 121410]|uniref:Uncharacterized protein n=1 Tax=Saccharata proteae CBS 121410 TaxID=1314787 RepID=A0A9P4LYU5_9PEZI|nr:hypothetical protein K490DRAFT_61409 [Saccharata proteae CBS 121410]
MSVGVSHASVDDILHLLKARKGRSLLLVLAIFLISFLLLRTNHGDQSWASMSSQSSTWRPSEANAETDGQPDAATTSEAETPHQVTSAASASVPQSIKPTFHLLLQAVSPNPDFCKAVLSATLLDYPPPTIIGYNHSGPQSALEMIHEHLQTPNIQDDDLVLLVNGNRIWFQLPPSVLLAQYQDLLHEANARLLENYGMTKPERAGDIPKQRYTQTIVFGATEQCWPSIETDAACAAVPDSPGSMVINDETAKARNKVNPVAPKYLAAGTVLGPARDLRALYSIASLKRGDDRSKLSSQQTLASMFGEQEYAREEARRASMSSFAVWMERLSTFFSWRRNEPLLAANVTPSPSSRYEFGIGLDYSSRLFQTLAAPRSFGTDIRFRATHSNHSGISTHVNTSLPHPLERLQSPFALLPNDHASSSTKYPNLANPLALHPDLDSLPHDALSWSQLSLARNTHTSSTPALLSFPVPEPPPPRTLKSKAKRSAAPETEEDGQEQQQSRDSQAENSAASIEQTEDLQSEQSQSQPQQADQPEEQDNPAATTTNPSQATDHTTIQYIDPRANLWTRLWFQPYARALLRRIMRASTATELIHEMEDSDSDSDPDQLLHQSFSRDSRGGRGGVWTSNAEWLSWGDVCAGDGADEAVFHDGKGVWLEELDEVSAFDEIGRQLEGWAPVFEGTPKLEEAGK